MNTLCTYTKDEILHLETEILAEALTLFQNLISWMDNDIFTDAPERAKSVAGAEEWPTRSWKRSKKHWQIARSPDHAHSTGSHR
ncbi:MAG: hypothetical protein PVG14_14325 [Anaerolineales bacterium]|jgi:hypothetical protein